MAPHRENSPSLAGSHEWEAPLDWHLFKLFIVLSSQFRDGLSRYLFKHGQLLITLRIIEYNYPIPSPREQMRRQFGRDILAPPPKRRKKDEDDPLNIFDGRRKGGRKK